MSLKRGIDHSRSVEPTMNICDLDEDSLACVFQYLLLDDLDRLVRVCKRFYQIVNLHVYAKKSANLLRTGHQRRKFTHVPSRDLHYDFSYRKRISLFENWRYGRYREMQFFYHRMLYFSHILLERRWLYMSHRGQLRAHERIAKGDKVLKGKASWIVGSSRDCDITWMEKKKDLVFAGRTDGSCFVYDCLSGYYRQQQLAEECITSVDFDGQLFVCATKSKSTSFWTGLEGRENFGLERQLQLDDGYQTIKLSPNGANQLAAGKYCDREKKALRLIDVESGSTSTLNSPTRAIYHVQWKDFNTILTGNFDTTFRVVDIRTGQDEAVWTDPYDSSVYCFDYDGAHAILCGMKHNFRVNLYDLRIQKRCIQMYFSTKKLSHYSPVYSLAADSSQLFLVTDHDLRVLNFDANHVEKKDYTFDLCS
ncbi:F-box/WD repeat-containing protein 4 [Topomyia yanbarensis]|uniref:F-box/WD repeat-containing protein 4 n=1 Tax=Topomyia yanbarensis TaxID=2498891 RepID=UPI00273C99FF|nr:F-box/WD repeat-containing protein 4 [Topomyia yanbarensis]